MANLMTKRGQHDNVVTYEHVCDTRADLRKIDPEYITLGSAAIVLQGANGLELYMATSNKTWILLSSGNSGGSGGGSPAIIPIDQNDSEISNNDIQGPYVNYAIVDTTTILI